MQPSVGHPQEQLHVRPPHPPDPWQPDKMPQVWPQVSDPANTAQTMVISIDGQGT